MLTHLRTAASFHGRAAVEAAYGLLQYVYESEIAEWCATKPRPLLKLVLNCGLDIGVVLRSGSDEPEPASFVLAILKFEDSEREWVYHDCYPVLSPRRRNGEPDPNIEFPELSHFITAYFHEDWDADQEARGEAIDPDLLVGHIIDENPVDFLANVSEQIGVVLERFDEPQLTRLIAEDFFGNVRPDLQFLTMRAWLERVLARVDARVVSETSR